MSSILLAGTWHCQDCGDIGSFEPVLIDSGDRRAPVYVEHECRYPEDERW